MDDVLNLSTLMPKCPQDGSTYQTGSNWFKLDQTEQKLTQHTTPIAKCRVSILWRQFSIDRQTSLVKKDHSLNTTNTPPRNTANTPQKHHQDMSKTPKTSPNTVKTLRTHHQRATKTPTTTETQLRDHQETSRTDTNKIHRHNYCFFTITIFSHHHHHNTSQHQHHHHHHHLILLLLLRLLLLFHQPCPHHHHQHHHRHQ